MEGAIREVFDGVTRTLEFVFAERPYLTAVQKAIDLLVERFRAGNKLLVLGTDDRLDYAQHVCGEFVSRSSMDDPSAPPTIALSEETAVSSLSDDSGFDASVFARQVEALGQPGDVAWGISGSRTSAKVVNALKAARSCGIQTIGLTAQEGSETNHLYDILMLVPLSSTPRIQEVYLVTCHVICAVVKRRLRLASVTEVARCPCGNVVRLSQINQLSAYCEECLGEFSVEEAIHRYLVR